MTDIDDMQQHAQRLHDAAQARKPQNSEPTEIFGTGKEPKRRIKRIW